METGYLHTFMVVLESGSMSEAARRLGVGVSIAPDAATAWWPTLPVARLPLPNRSEARRFGVVWPRASPRSRAVEVLVEHARRVMAERAGTPAGAR